MQNQVHTHNVLDTGKIGRLLMKLSVPMLLGSLVNLIYSVTETVFIGRYVGTAGIAVFSVVFPLQMISQGVSNMVGIGGASLISRLIGSRDNDNAERALGNGIAAGVVLSLILTVLVLPFVNYWIKLVGASDAVLPYAREYLIIITGGVVFTVLSTTLIIYVRAEGNARVSMTGMIISAGLNVVLDAVFIIWLNMGMKGAAIATVISQGTATFYILIYYFSGNSYLKLHLRNLKPDFKILRSILAIGIAQFMQTVANAFASLFIVKMAAAYGGDLGLSTFGIIQRLLFFGGMPGMVLGQAMQPVLGFNYGAKRFNNGLKSITLAAGAAAVLSTAVFLTYFFLPTQIVSLFTNDQPLIDACSRVMRIAFLALPLMGVFTVGGNTFPSIGKVMQTFIVAILRPAGFLLPLVLILPHFFQLNGVWMSFAITDALSFVMVVVLLIPLFRMFRKAAAQEKSANPGFIETPASVE